MNEIYAIYGCGGYAREVMPLLRECVNVVSKDGCRKFVFIDDFVDEMQASEVSVEGRKHQRVEHLAKEKHRVSESCGALLGERLVHGGSDAVAEADHEDAIRTHPHDGCKGRVQTQAAVRVVA